MKDNRGFTLIEVLLSIVILAVIVTTFFQFFIMSQETTVNNQDKLVAINIAQKVLEQIKEDSQAQVNSDDSQYWEITHLAAAVNYPKTYGAYTETADSKQFQVIVNVDTTLDNGLQMVTITVHGNDNKILSTVKGLVEL